MAIRTQTPATLQARQGTDYFQHIDGIRCLAVTAVLLFHAQVPGMSGGYVGVDVFFVISGFLITRICVRDGFSYGAFFRGRARRILPAYYVWLIVTCLASAAILLPGHLEDLSVSVLAATAFVQNVAFWKQIDYFAGGENNPILHTWSLAVEWQFYLLFPLLLAPVRSRRGLLIGLLGTMAAMSFALCVWATVNKPVPAFYLTPFRVWEFVIGGLVSFAGTRKGRAGVDEAIALLGLAMVVGACFAYDEATYFPGYAALLPCLGTAALIYAGLTTEKPRVLGVFCSGPAALFGKASYSIYLVHWPILVLVGYFHPLGMPAGVVAACLAASVTLGIVSWLYVEAPFRQPGRISPRGKTLTAAAATVLLLAAGGAAQTWNGFPQRFSPEVQRLAAAADDKGRFRHCLGNDLGAKGIDGLCRLGDSAAQPSFLIWGDSHADALLEGFDMAARAAGAGGVFVGTDSCPPLAGVEGMFKPSRARCADIQRRVPELIRGGTFRSVFLAAAWSRYALHDPAGFQTALNRTFAMLGPMAPRITVLGLIPGARASVPDTLAKGEAFGIDTAVEVSTGDGLLDLQYLDETIGRAAVANGLAFVDIKASLCRDRCDVVDAGHPLYFDASHLSPQGSRRVVRNIVQAHPLSADVPY